MQSKPVFDWIVLRRQIEEFAAERNRPPTPMELRRFLADHDIGPELLGTFLAGMAESKPAKVAKPLQSSLAATASRTPTSQAAPHVPVTSSPVAAPALSSAAVEAGSTDGKGDEPGTQLTGRLADVVEDLVDDWHRQGGVLQRDQIISLATKRKLTGDELAAVDHELVRLGVEASTRSEAPELRRDARRLPARGDEDLVRAYLGEIGRYRLIDAEEEVRLGRAIHAGQRAAEALSSPDRSHGPADVRLHAVVAEGRSAHSRLVEANLRLVVSVARQPRYVATTTEFIDRIQDGNRGLMRAADKFNPEMGFKFSTYATWWIKQAIERSVADTGRAIRIPVHLHEKLGKLRKARYRLGGRLDREPTHVELAEATGYSPGEVQAMIDYLAPVRSLDESVGDDLILLDLLADQADDVDGRGDPQDHFLTADKRRKLNAILDLIPARQRNIIIRRYDLHGRGIETLDAIGRDLGIGRERVRQLEKKTLELLQSSAQVGLLYDYLLTDTRLDQPRPATGWPRPPATRATRPAPAELADTCEGQP